MKIYPFDAIYPNVNLIASTDSFFGTVRDDYSEYFKNGFFHHSDQRAFYIMEIRAGNKVHSGIVVCLNIKIIQKVRL